MGILLRSYTFNRSTVLSSGQKSWERAQALLEAVEEAPAAPRVKRESNNISALAYSLGLFVKVDGVYKVSAAGERYRALHAADAQQAWRWLVTRGLWLNIMPNGTAAGQNKAARALGVVVNPFRTILAVLIYLSELNNDYRYLYFEEFCSLFDVDENWVIDPEDLAALVEGGRRENWKSVEERRSLLGDLEEEFGVSRDNLSSTFKKLFKQTGLFDFAVNGTGQDVGIALSRDLDADAQRWLDHMLDHEPSWDSAGESWDEYLGRVHDNDLPAGAQAVIATTRAPRTRTTRPSILSKDRSIEAIVARLVEREAKKGEFDPSGIRDARERIARAIAARMGQPGFRRDLLEAYGERCAVTGYDVPGALEAAHIVPFLGEDTMRVSNGLLLRADIHTLFDRGLLAVQDKGGILTVRLSSSLLGTQYEDLEGSPLAAPAHDALAPSRLALASHLAGSSIDVA